jgi:beta-glucosidase
LSGDNRLPERSARILDKVTLNPGQTAKVNIPLGPSSFSIWRNQGWVELPGQYRIMVGDSSANLPLKTTISIS